jgi:alpha-1,6-mannosyltransferase
VQAFAPALVFTVGALICRLLLSHVPARFTIDMQQPMPVVTWWGSTGATFIAVLFATLALAAVPYARMLRSPAMRSARLLAASACALAFGLFWLPLFSSDVYAYAAYGEMVRVGVNPYARVTLPGNDVLITAAQWQWSGSLPVCVYGVAFVAIAAAIVGALHALEPAAQLQAFRVLSCASFLLCAYLLARTGRNAESDRDRGRGAALFFALNPVAVWSAIEGHNDTLMLAVTLAGVALYRRHAFAGALVATLGGAIKLPAVISGAALALPDIVQNRRRFPLFGVLAGALLVALASVPIIAGTTTDLAPHGHYAPLASVQSLHPLLAVALAIAALWRIRTAASVVDRYCLLALTAWLAIPNPYPWYALWLLPLAAWTTDRRIALTTLAVTSCAMLRYIPDATALPNPITHVALGLADLLAYTPLLRRDIIGRS